MPPGDTTPEKTAPAPLRLVQRFVNSVDLENGEDELTTPAGLRDWLLERDLIEAGDTVGAADLRRALDVREGLRALLLANNGMAPDAELVERLPPAPARAGGAARPRRGACGRAGRVQAGRRAAADSRGKRSRRRDRPADGDRRGLRRAGQLGPAQGLPPGCLPLGVLRPVQEPLRPMVPDGGVRQHREGP